jgi:eukaryotic translation initiation factor 2C
MELIARLQSEIAPEIFTPRAVYDGRKNLFAPRELPLGETGYKEVCCAMWSIFLSSETAHSLPFLL